MSPWESLLEPVEIAYDQKPVKIQLVEPTDYISLIRESKDGYTYCGPRIIKVKDDITKRDVVTTDPKGFIYYDTIRDQLFVNTPVGDELGKTFFYTIQFGLRDYPEISLSSESLLMITTIKKENEFPYFVEPSMPSYTVEVGEELLVTVMLADPEGDKIKLDVDVSCTVNCDFVTF